jgi:hypothetical protein
MTRASDRSSELADAGQGAIEDFFRSLDSLNEGQILGLAAAWEDREKSPYQDAVAQALVCAEESGLTAQLEKARAAVVQWATCIASDRWAPGTALPDARLSLQVRRQAMVALADAAVAIVLGDRLDDASREILLNPWLGAVEGEA